MTPTDPLLNVISSTASLSLTPEQEAILASEGNIKINAVAGSGKTTTVLHYAVSRPQGSRILYLAFNKSVRLEARKKFDEKGLQQVQVETAHSLAYKAVVPRYNYTIRPQGYTTFEIAELLGLSDGGEKHGAFVLANHIVKFTAYFCNSSVQKVQDLNYLETVTDAKAKAFVKAFYSHIVEGTRYLLKRMKEGEIEITHDFYLKLYQLSNPVLPFDYILFDEAQDASPAMLDVFLKQPATKVIVGDTHQQIYSWRYAVNSLQKASFAEYSLTTSFRFHQHIANLGKEILLWKKHVEETSRVTIVSKGKPCQTQHKATIARTNLGLLLQAIGYIKRHPDVKKLYFEGNINSYTYADDGASLYDVLNLYNGKPGLVRDRLLQTMKSMADLEEYIEKTGDVQLGMMVEIVNEYGNEIPGLIKELKSEHVEDADKEKAEMIFFTAHRCKGMKYDAVQLADDFITEAALEKEAVKKEEERASPVKLNEEINLLYVAVTRTKGVLRIPEKLLPKGFPPSPHIIVIPVEKQDKNQSANDLNKQGDKPCSFAEIRLAHKNAYECWSEESNDELRRLFHRGVSIPVLAKHFGRKPGAIISRLKKIGCSQGSSDD